MFSVGAIRNCGRRVLCRFQDFFIFLDECADDAALRHFVELFASSCSSVQLDAAT
jgi:hypothetical protein